MRFDSKLDAGLGLTSRQQLFAETWFNQVHEFSLDAFRVRVMNPVNILEELMKSLSDSLFDSADRTRIWGELVAIFEDAALLDSNHFKKAKRELLLLIKEALAKPKESEKHHALIDAYSRELHNELRHRYISECTGWLASELNTVHAGAGEDPALMNIEKTTGQLLSCLVAAGWSIESLYKMYRTTFTSDVLHTEPGQPYSFTAALTWMFTRLGREHKDYRVTFVINQISNAGAIPEVVGDISFNANPPVVAEASPESAKKFAKPGGTKLFATMAVKANDGRIAGMRAAAHIEQVLDVVRYDFLKQNFTLSDSFLVEKEDKHILLNIVKTVPNPSREVTQQELHDFMTRLGNLVSSGTLREESKDRIYSAFRLYRTGAETSNLENKLVNWWTALEYLVKAGGSGGIGLAVENALFPTVTFSYVVKHLEASRTAMRHLNVELKDPAGSLIDYTNMKPAELFMLLADTKVQSCIKIAVAASPYASLYFKKLFQKMSTPEALNSTLEKHEQAVKWQVQRIYRARCDIVHSAGRVDQAALLCANLESYLKTLLDNFLQSLNDLQTMRAPKEFFDRQRYSYERVMASLKAKDSSLLLEKLSVT